MKPSFAPPTAFLVDPREVAMESSLDALRRVSRRSAIPLLASAVTAPRKVLCSLRLTDVQLEQELERRRFQYEKLGASRHRPEARRRKAMLEYLPVYPCGSRALSEASFRASPIIGWFMFSPAEWHFWR